MKAIIELTSWKASQARALRAAKKADAGKSAKTDYHLDFDSMASLFSDITPARMQVVETSKRLGALSVYALAKALGETTRMSIATSANCWNSNFSRETRMGKYMCRGKT